MVKIYIARGMSGRIKRDVVEEAQIDKWMFEKLGFTVLDPVAEEGVEASDETLMTTKEIMVHHWRRDKQMIREAHVVVDMTPHLKSEGVAHEVGYARYHLWKKVVRVYPTGQLPAPSSVAFLEDDFLTDDVFAATKEIYRTHGTLWKRLKWRAGLYRRCFLKAVWNRLKEWK